MRHVSLFFLVFLIHFFNSSLTAQTIQYNDKLEGYVFEDIDGTLYSDLVFEEATYIDQKNWKVKFNGKYGLYGNDGYFNLNPIYEDIIRAQDSWVIVKIDGFCGIVDYEGNIIVEPKYDMIDHYDQLIDRDNERGSLFQLNGIWGNWEGEEFVETKDPIFLNPSVIPDPYFCNEDEDIKLCIYKEIFRDLKYPVKARETGTQGTVMIMFIVEADGSMTTPEVIQSADFDLDSEALGVVKGIFNDWAPGLSNNKPVATRIILPIRFRLE